MDAPPRGDLDWLPADVLRDLCTNLLDRGARCALARACRALCADVRSFRTHRARMRYPSIGGRGGCGDTLSSLRRALADTILWQPDPETAHALLSMSVSADAPVSQAAGAEAADVLWLPRDALIHDSIRDTARFEPTGEFVAWWPCRERTLDDASVRAHRRLLDLVRAIEKFRGRMGTPRGPGAGRLLGVPDKVHAVIVAALCRRRRDDLLGALLWSPVATATTTATAAKTLHPRRTVVLVAVLCCVDGEDDDRVYRGVQTVLDADTERFEGGAETAASPYPLEIALDMIRQLANHRRPLDGLFAAVELLLAAGYDPNAASVSMPADRDPVGLYEFLSDRVELRARTLEHGELYRRLLPMFARHYGPPRYSTRPDDSWLFLWMRWTDDGDDDLRVLEDARRQVQGLIGGAHPHVSLQTEVQPRDEPSHEDSGSGNLGDRLHVRVDGRSDHVREAARAIRRWADCHEPFRQYTSEAYRRPAAYITALCPVYV